MLYNTQIIMISAFLVLTLMLGLYAKRREPTYLEYAVGNKRFSTLILMVTTLATVYEGSVLMFYIPDIHNFPLKNIVFGLLSPFFYLVISMIYVRIIPFRQHISLAETIGYVYGKYPRIITALLSIFYSICIITIQILAMSLVISMCVDSIDNRIIGSLATLILIAYTTFGGIRGVVSTDVLQFITFTIIICLIARLMFDKTGKSLLEIILFLKKQEKFQFSNPERNLAMLNWVVYSICMLIPMHKPAVMHRLYITSSPIKIKKSFWYTFLLSLLMELVILSIAIFVFVMDPSLSNTEIWPYILSHIPSAFKGCIAICVLGMSMSTVDSALHICSVMISHDILESIRGVKSVTCIYKIRLAKLTSLITGLLAMTLAIWYNDVMKILFTIYSYGYTLFFSTISAPFILAIFGFRGTSRTALIGMTTGVTTMLICMKLDQYIPAIFPHIFGIVTNGLAMIIAHYLLPQPAGKGWIGRTYQQKRMNQLILAFKKYRQSIDQ
ncbi:sodium:solute symporter family protein [Candidatus Cardinium sp. TP]|uniref:sodium:solute symporter family protein n=1 Tax=Candidatus Cardinium sp. TP TaxID=2961955 RepID=UPI00289EDFF0|nr:sodium:solute symporter family protein [Candidatus Cardinium sp. TP]